MENQALEITSESNLRLEYVEKELSQLKSLLQDQEQWIERQVDVCGGEIESLQAEMEEVEEGSKLTEAVNNATQSQLQVGVLYSN